MLYKLAGGNAFVPGLPSAQCPTVTEVLALLVLFSMVCQSYTFVYVQKNCQEWGKW